jgi:hypothetical protein
MSEQLERLRDRYRPHARETRMLLLEESPPPGGGFFYDAQSTLFDSTRRVLAGEFSFPHEPSSFLSAFGAAGFLLEEFSAKRGDKPASRVEDPAVQSAVARIARLISTDRPIVVVGVLQRIEPLVALAVERSDHPGTPWRCLHFPSWRSERSRQAYRQGLREVIDDFSLLATTCTPPTRSS